MTRLVVQNWHTECGACGYGSGGWAAAPKPILTPRSRECPGCGALFTEAEYPYEGGRVEPIEDAA